MPIEIKELHIKINVDKGSSSKDTESKNNNSKSDDKAKLVATCVEAVLDVLERQKER
jgi:hypothetical protein